MGSTILHACVELNALSLRLTRDHGVLILQAPLRGVTGNGG